jgi:hypothetical protein
MRRVVLVGVIAAVLAAAYVISTSHNLKLSDRGTPYVRTYSGGANGLRAAMAAGDGQAYGALAQDPTMARPGVFVDGRRDASYRYQRPLLGYLAWAVSLGRPQWEPGAQAAIVVGGAAVAVGACAEMLRRRRREPLLALAVLLMPGMSSSLSGLTTEPVALALLTLGLLAWQADRRRVVLAVVWFSLAALSRESSLFVPAALAVIEASNARGDPRGAWARRAAPLVAPFAVYLGWIVLLRARLGAWPFAGSNGSLDEVPFRGLVHALGGFADPTRSWLWLLVGVALVMAALARRRRDELSLLVVAYGLFAAFISAGVWHRWQDFSRPLLPLYAYGVLIALTWAAGASRTGRTDVRSGQSEALPST